MTQPKRDEKPRLRKVASNLFLRPHAGDFWALKRDVRGTFNIVRVNDDEIFEEDHTR